MSVQVSHVHGEAIWSGRMPSVIGVSEVEERGLLVVLMFLRVWAGGPRITWGRDSDFEVGVRRLGPAPPLSFAAFAASL